jgi:NADH-quinone oxidoreductase subunit L
VIIALVFLPLLGAIIAGIFSREISVKMAQMITCSFMAISALSSVFVFYDVAIIGNSYNIILGEFISSGGLNIHWSLSVDVLTSVMLIVVTSVSFVVHIYSIGYMSHDLHIQRFMSYLSLFTFSMLMLVTADNFVQLFFGWEGVGVCSYLLIGFWYQKKSATNAAIKAFLVNRVSDFVFVIGLATIFLAYGSLSFKEVFAAASQNPEAAIVIGSYSINVITLICILLFIGAMGKSAQIGLHTWLPDAMEGPTPVSALIHAATMVTAGVFLVVRCSYLFEYSEVARNMVTIVGAVTAIFAAYTALSQNDIKRVVAYSTCSQLGYMFLACGVSAYSAAIFHLMTHAFFKALLFLGAGSVIHAMSGEQDINKMGGIYKLIPLTYGLMWIGSLALAGIFPFAGYFSKDVILESAFVSHGNFAMIAYIIGIITAMMTAFYSIRVIIKVFHGKQNFTKEVKHHIHESPLVMTIPLILLAVGACLSGVWGFYILDMVGDQMQFWRGSIKVLGVNNVLEHIHHIDYTVKYLPLVIVLFGMGSAFVCYKILKHNQFDKIINIIKPLYLMSKNKLYFDEIYNIIFIQSYIAISENFWKFVDVIIIDGFGPNGVAGLVRFSAIQIRKLQTGFLYSYVMVMIIGVLALISWHFYINIIN